MIKHAVRARSLGFIGASLLALASLSGCAETGTLNPALTSTMAPQPQSAAPEAAPSVPVAEAPETQPADELTTNKHALKIIEDSEGLRLHSYRLAGQLLIGYGHAVADLPQPSVSELTITRDEAERLLQADVRMCEDAVRHALKVEVTENEFSAMVALCYNVGPGRFSTSSIVRHLNAGERASAANAFMLYVNAKLDDEKVEVPVLAERRARERDLFLTNADSTVADSSVFDLQLRRL
jgi:GH24 family phage-related lysozyme (muramidase)